MMLTLEVQTKIPVATETWRSRREWGSLLSSWQQAWPSTRVLSQQLLHSVSAPPTPLHLFPNRLLDASLPAWCWPNKPRPPGQRGNGVAASWASTSRPSTTLQTNSAVGHKPRATWNLSLPALHGWFTPQNQNQARGLNASCTWLKWENLFYRNCATSPAYRRYVSIWPKHIVWTVSVKTFWSNKKSWLGR